MLPLDKLSDKALQALQASGIEPSDIDMALHLDMNLQGMRTDTYLVYSRAKGSLYRLTATAEDAPTPVADTTSSPKKKGDKQDQNTYTIDVWQLSELTEPYIDNYVTSTRLQAHRHAPDDLPPQQGDMSDDAYRVALRTYQCSGETIVIGQCTNACKLKLLAFLTLWDRLSKGEEIADNDGIFEQFSHNCPKCGKPYEDALRKVCKHCTQKKGVLTRLLGYFKDFKPQLVIVALCLLGSTALSLITPIVSGQILFDQVIMPEGSMHEIHYVYIWVSVLIAMALLGVFIGIVQSRTNAYMSTRVVRNMKNEIFTAMQRLSLSYFNQNPTGRLINRVNYDAERVRSFFIDGVPYFISHVISYIALSVILFCINWKLTLILFSPILPIVLIIKFALPKLWKCYSHVWRHSSSMNSMMNDSLTGIRVVKAFAKEDSETNRFYNYSSKLYKANLRAQLVGMTIFPVISILIGAIGHSMWGFAGFEVMGERMTYGQLTTYMGYIGLIFGPLNFFTNFANMVTDTMNSAVRMFEVLDMTPEVLEAPNPVKLETIEGEIVFSHVNFHYAPNRPILKDISFTIHKGDHVGLVGHTGSGKSTIANLLTRMYDVVSGSITIDGIDIKDLETKSLRRNVAIVSQEVYIFRGTIADNIRYGKPDASMDEVISAAKAANAHDFIMRLPEGYNTKVGIGSRSLSGGERQRVSIARALLMNPALLILDEATAAMDTETERLISEAIERVSEGKTTISIAHRLSTLKNCNYIMAIDNGELAEMGTQEELMERQGIYYRLWTLQNEQLRKVMEGK